MPTTTTPRISSFKLNDGQSIPWLGFGTGTALLRQECTDQLTLAIHTGFTHLDTAQRYGNEDSLAAAIKSVASTIPREQLYVTTKFKYLAPDVGETVRAALQGSLDRLGLTYVDAYLIHWPIDVEDRLEEVWKEMIQLREEGLVKSIGVSNFRVKDIERLVKATGVAPALHQIEFHPYLVKATRKLFEYSKQHDIRTQSWGTLTSLFRSKDGPVDPVVKTIQARLEKDYGKPVSENQALLKWCFNKGIVAVTTSSKAERIEEYLQTENIPDLTPEEVKAIDDAGSERHYRALEAVSSRADEYKYINEDNGF